MQTTESRPTIIRTTVARRPRLHFPRTFEDRAALGVREMRVPASFEDFVSMAQDCDYRIHYREGQIISFIEINEKDHTVMGEATVAHEALVMRIGRMLDELLESFPDDTYHVLGSNTRLFIHPTRHGYNADITVVKGAVEEETYKYNRRSVSGISNPWLIVEVLSESTREFDLSEKLQDYKEIPSLQQVIFVEQGEMRASTYIRAGRNEWRNLDLLDAGEAIPVGSGSLPLSRIYANIPLKP